MFLNACERNKFAASAQTSRRALELTRREYHDKAFALRLPGVQHTPFPQTLHSFRRVTALMKFDGFRTFANYASWAMSMHIAEGHDWTQQLAQEFKQAVRSVDRG